MNPAPRPPAWKVAPKPAPAPKRSLLARLLRRREPTTFQKALAVHLFHAAPTSALR